MRQPGRFWVKKDSTSDWEIAVYDSMFDVFHFGSYGHKSDHIFAIHENRIIGPEEENELMETVKLMRHFQKVYFAAPKGTIEKKEALQESKRLENKVDELLNPGAQQTIFSP
jgi:hypothetical protein